jgi:hypothetical protein
MPRSSLQSRRWWIIGALCLALAGCSAVRLGYNQAPTLAYWWLDGYADFDDAQTHEARLAIDRWFDWHRRTQLPDLAALLVRAQADVRRDATAQQTCRWWGELRTRSEAAIDRALPDIAAIAATLTPAQLRHVEQRYDKSNREFREEFLDGDRAERLQRSIKRTVERAEMLYGRLDDTQREALARRLAESPFDPERWMAERLARQRDALALLNRIAGDSLSQEQAVAALRAYVATWSRSPREDYRRYAEQLEQFNCRVAAAVHNGTTSAQRQQAAAKLHGWEEDLRALAGQGR